MIVILLGVVRVGASVPCRRCRCRSNVLLIPRIGHDLMKGIPDNGLGYRRHGFDVVIMQQEINNQLQYFPIDPWYHDWFVT